MLFCPVRLFLFSADRAEKQTYTEVGRLNTDKYSVAPVTPTLGERNTVIQYGRKTESRALRDISAERR